MPALTIPDLDEGELMMEFIKKFATSLNITEEDPLGQIRQTLQGLITKLNAEGMATATGVNSAAALVARIGAEAARDSLNTTGKVFTAAEGTAAGIAATANGQQFSVLAADLLSYRIIRNNAGAPLELESVATQRATAATASRVNGLSRLTEVDRYTNASVYPGYRNKDSGALIPAPAWVTILIPYDAKHEYQYTATGNTGSVGLVVAYNAASARLATLDATAAAAGKVIDHALVPAGTTQLGFSALAANAHSVIERVFSVEPGALGDIPAKIDANAVNMALVLKTGAQVDFASQPNTRPGFLNQDGVFQANANWKLTDRVEWSEAAVFMFTGFGHVSNVASVEMYNDADQPIGVLFATGVQVVDRVISSALPGWNPACSGVRACGAINGSNVFAFKVTRKTVDESLLPSIRTMKTDIAALKAAAPTSVRMLAPKQVYARVGEPLFLYARQIVQDPTIDLAWNVPNTNDMVAAITPTSTADIPLILQGMGRDGAAVQLAAFSVKVSPTVLVSPAVPQNFIFGLADSLTDSVANADMSGAMPNEVSRRLTNVGRDILPPGPASYGLSNIFFRGTRTGPGGVDSGGNNLPPIEAVRHEGRPGWDADDYLTLQTGPNGLNNAFWNPGTSLFDINYYLAQNGFDAASTPSGVVTDGSNLTMIMLLGWNDVYDSTAAASAARVADLIDRIKVGKPQAKFMLIGLNPPPKLNRKAFEQTRYVSPAQIFQKAIVEFGLAYRDMAATKANVSFLQVSQEFDPEVAYRRASFPTRARSPGSESSAVSMVTDHVHPGVVGYAMMADVITKAILHGYCRGV